VNKIGAHAFEAKVAPVLRSLAMSFSTLLYFAALVDWRVPKSETRRFAGDAQEILSCD